MTTAGSNQGGGTSGSIGRQIRGSSLLLVGRLISKFINFGVQIAIVRLLTKDDFGAFAYGLALVLAGELVVQLGLGRGSRRLVPRYFEAGEHHRLLGTLALVTGTIVTLGALGFIGLLAVYYNGWSGFPGGEGGQVVLILAVLAPVQALDALCVQTLACVSSARKILVRKHIIGPGLRVAAVAAAYLSQGGTIVLAWAYLIGGVLGLLVCLRITWRELHAKGILPTPIKHWEVPWRPLLRTSMPLVTNDLVFVASTAVTSVLLMQTGSEEDVAAMRAVVPAGMLVLLVLQSFALLFMPTAIRSQTQNGVDALRDHHWQSASWVSVLSFPLFALMFCIAPDLVPLLFGEAYAESAALLAILAMGHYLFVCCAFNGETLQLLGHVRPILYINIAAIAVTLGLALWLCPTHGALGAAIAVASARGVAALVRHWVLTRQLALGPAPQAQRNLWLKLAAATTLASVVGWLWQPPLLVQLLCVGAVSLLLLRSTSQTLDVRQSFPELLRLPLLGRLVAP